MGNSTSKAEDDEASLYGKENTSKKLSQNESLVSGSKDASYENDSYTCPDSKSTLETEFTGPSSKKQTSHDKSKQRTNANTGNKSSFKGQKQAKDETTQPGSHITDDQVHVNLAMADLMAYLQVVANNSNNLPLTRRDDPELGRTVSNLTADEYARKSAAFIPSDVRMIGGAFTRYGRVWDLPTSEEFNACDGAQEPGKFRTVAVNKSFPTCQPHFSGNNQVNLIFQNNTPLFLQVDPTEAPAVIPC